MPKASDPARPQFFFIFFFIALTWLDVVRYRAAISPFTLPRGRDLKGGNAVTSVLGNV